MEEVVECHNNVQRKGAEQNNATNAMAEPRGTCASSSSSRRDLPTLGVVRIGSGCLDRGSMSANGSRSMIELVHVSLQNA